MPENVINPAMGKRQALVEAYIGALGIRAVLIHAGPDGKPVRIGLSRLEHLDIFDALWFAKPAHAELVLANCRDDFAGIGALTPDGSVDLSARTVRDYVVNVASLLGAAWRSEAELRADAARAVEEIIARVEVSRQSGGLAQVNRSYKIYRQQQVARGEKAIPYSAHLAAVTRSLVVLAAQNADAF